MKTDLHSLKQSVEQWVSEACQQGILSDRFSHQIEQFNAHTPASLFAIAERPLVVGFFGGTGVGKSTLLNRLAGEDVARTGVERPTSREVTLYLHSTVKVDHLPREYPIGQIKSAFHNNDANREILWIDMPDFDSAEVHNRHLVNDWLPHIDTLVYVVSPERYRDDNGWRLLLEHGGKHAWVFVINHWDRGAPAQREDFRSLLAAAGLEDPQLFCTDSGPAPEEDEFGALEEFIQSMASSNTIAQLESRGILMRIRELQSVVEEGIGQLGTAEDFSRLKTDWDAFWSSESSSLLASMQWKYPLLTAHYAAQDAGLIRSLWRRLSGRARDHATAVESLPEPAPATPGTQLLFERDQADSISDDIQQLVQSASRQQLPASALRTALQPLGVELEARLNQRVEQTREQALQNPGSAPQRFLGRLFSMLSSLLPLAAIGWAGYRIVEAFYQGGSQPAQYLGSNFAINALLLVGLSWLLPFVLARKIKPSRQRVASRAMQQGARQALDELQQDVHRAVDALSEQVQSTAAQGRDLFSTLPASDATVSREFQRTLIERTG